MRMVMLVLRIILAAAAAITPEGFVIELGDCWKGRLPVNSRASVPPDGER